MNASISKSHTFQNSQAPTNLAQDERLIRLIFNGASISGPLGSKDQQQQYLITKGLAERISWQRHVPDLSIILATAVANKNEEVLSALLEVVISQRVKAIREDLWADLLSYNDGIYSSVSEARIELALTWALGCYDTLPKEVLPLLCQLAKDGVVSNDDKQVEAKHWLANTPSVCEVSRALAILVLVRFQAVDVLKGLKLIYDNKNLLLVNLVLNLWKEHKELRAGPVDLRMFNVGCDFADTGLNRLSSLLARLSDWPNLIISSGTDRAAIASATAYYYGLSEEAGFDPKLRIKANSDYGIQLIRLVKQGDRLASKGACSQLLKSKDIINQISNEILSLLEIAERGPLWSRLNGSLKPHNYAALVTLAVNSAELKEKYPYQIFKVVCAFNTASASECFFTVPFFNSSLSERLFNVATKHQKVIFFDNLDGASLALKSEAFERHVLNGLRDPSPYIQMISNDMMTRYILRLVGRSLQQESVEFMHRAEAAIKAQKLSIKGALAAWMGLVWTGHRNLQSRFKAPSRCMNSKKRALMAIELMKRSIIAKRRY